MAGGKGRCTVSDDRPMQTVAITLAYDGAPFSGFARQEARCTVQGELESALQILSRCPIETVGAGRTDAGVHAKGQVVSCALPMHVSTDIERLVLSLNALTPPALVVRAVQTVPETFNARFDAVSRTYVYRIAQCDGAPPLFMAPYSWNLTTMLDIDAMRTAAAVLVGEHDFTSFCVAKSASELQERDLSTCRQILSADLDYEEELGERMLRITVKGNAFLHSMVRVIVGTLVDVGRGNKEPTWVAEVLDARDRTRAGQTAPAHGLMLDHIDYR